MDVGSSRRGAPVVIVGVSGGIGRALCEALVADARFGRVFGLSRCRPKDWVDGYDKHWLPVDILDEATVLEAAAIVSEDGSPSRIIVATGMLHGPELSPEKSMRMLDPYHLATLFAVNAIGPALVAKHFLPMTPRTGSSHFAVLSARVGSIGDNQLGGWHSYRMSKAALNMLVRSLAIEHRRTHPDAVCVALHPGTVDTALSAPFRRQVGVDKLFTPAQSAHCLLGILDRLEPKDTGGFFAWDGQVIPW